MKQRPQTGLYLRSTSISAQHKNGAKKQMKKIKQVKEKNTQMSLIFHLFFLCLILSMTSCSGKSDYQFRNSADAMKQYREFHHSIMPVEAINPGQDTGIPGLHAEQDLPAEPWCKAIYIT